MSSARNSHERILYVRQQIAGDDLAFHRENREWTAERPEHFIECLGVCLQVLPTDRFVEFHASKAEEFNAVGTELKALADHSQSWFDQEGNKDRCHALMDRVIHLCLDILDLAERV